jgi:prophage regulatory protein
MDRVLKLHEVEARVGLKKSAIYEQIDAGNFPKAIQLTTVGRASGWRESEINAWIAGRNTKPKRERKPAELAAA